MLDPDRIRRRFPDLWAGWLRAHFRNPEAVAAGFAVSFSTACNWWNGECAPSGSAVVIALRRFPSEAASLLKEAA